MIESVTAILAETAQAEILPRFRALGEGDTRRKSGGEPVTVADEKAEARLNAALTGLLPGSCVVGEEAASADPEIFGRLAGEAPVWIVDPIDGTGNFAAGRPVFAVMVALAKRGETVAAWIHSPIEGSTAVAEQGAGAWFGGRRIKVAIPESLEALRGTLHASSFAAPEIARQVEQRRERVEQVKSLRCAGAEYVRMARGELHFSLFTKLMPWDHAPGTLLHREAGGVQRLLDGSDYQPTKRSGAGLLMAPDERAWQHLYSRLFGAE